MDATKTPDHPSPAGGGGASQRLKEITRRLVAEFAPERIILFGSHAWGHPDENSDVDLLVVVPESDLPPPQRAARAYRCLREVPVPLDILVKTREEVERSRHVPASLIHEILERGRVLYG
jgi:predicted nucleotidyltransferase